MALTKKTSRYSNLEQRLDMAERTLLRLVEQWESEANYQTDAIGYRVRGSRSYDFECCSCKSNNVVESPH